MGGSKEGEGGNLLMVHIALGAMKRFTVVDYLNLLFCFTLLLILTLSLLVVSDLFALFSPWIHKLHRTNGGELPLVVVASPKLVKEFRK